MINYGELRNSVLGLIDLYSVAAMIYPDLFTLEEVEQIAEDPTFAQIRDGFEDPESSASEGFGTWASP